MREKGFLLKNLTAQPSACLHVPYYCHCRCCFFVVEGSKNFHLLILQYRQHPALKENQQVFK